MVIKKTLADVADQSKTYYELLVKNSKNVRKYPFKVHPKGAPLLKMASSSDFVQSAIIPKSDKVTILSSKIKPIGSMDTLQVSWKGKVGFVSLNRIIAPSIIGRARNLFRKPAKQADARVNTLNAKIQEYRTKVAQVRTSLPGNLPDLKGLEIRFISKGGDSSIMDDVAFVYDAPLRKDSIGDIAFGLDKTRLPYWITKVPEFPSLSEAFFFKGSFIYKNEYLKKFLKDVYDIYVDKSNGRLSLQTSVYKILPPGGGKPKQFFEEAIIGPEVRPMFFANGDPQLILDDAKNGKCTLKFDEESYTSDELMKLYEQGKVCIVVENAMGSSAKIGWRTVANTSIGLYHTDYLRSLRDAIELQD